MRIAVTGANGLFGSGLVRVIGSRHEVLPMSRAQADLTNLEQLRNAFKSLNPEVVIHTAAIADPDRCELNPEEAFRVNVGGTSNVVAAAEELGFGVVLISTDAVFDGFKSSPYTESDVPRPLSVYGRSKVEAEKQVQQLARHCIFRVSVLFGPGKLSFVSKGLQRISARETYVVASDQVGSATYTLDAAEKILEVVESQQYGLYHLCNLGQCSRLELARYAAELAGLDKSKIQGRTLDQMGRPGPRPKYAVMEMHALKAGDFALPRSWKAALAEYLKQFWSTSVPTSQ
jgi:dTDP-4-dehydrorhamnose reductase